ncbi:hypothetical protein [Paraburkholderia sp. MM5477-R1]|uniref:hypothetical protein n=1 Tax=Paraburkholderia sp. MM5477-R1 TaxID=2991062 RepID=UPI003D1F9B99
MPTAAAELPKTWKIYAAVGLSFLCTGFAAYYGMRGLPRRPETLVCHWFLNVNPRLCDVQSSGSTQIEGYLQAIYVVLLACLAFLVHAIKRPTGSRSEKIEVKSPLVDGRKDQAKGSESPSWESEEHGKPVKVSNGGWFYRLNMLITGPKFCVLVLLIFPSIVFIFATISHGEPGPAVFVMALVAIYVAAEHYSSLERQGSIVLRQEIATDRLERQMESLANALGTSYSQRQILDAYSKTEDEVGDSASMRGIYAIYKYPDIDQEWWTPNLPDDVWRDYFSSAKQTLFNSIKRGRRTKILLVVTDPPPLVISNDARDEKADKFIKLLGIAWYCVCLHEAAKAVKDADYQIKIATTSNWMHVVDNQVFQLIGTPPDKLSVRDLNFDINVIVTDSQDSDRVAQAAKRNLVNWAINDIVRVSERGTSAEEYLGAILMSLFIERKWGADHSIDRKGVEGLLEDLGLEAWENEGKLFNCPDNRKQIARKFFIELLYEFIQRRPLKQQAPDDDSREIRGPTDIGWELQ